MSDWTVADLQKWDDKICRVGEDFGLDWFPIDYEIIIDTGLMERSTSARIRFTIWAKRGCHMR